MNPLSAIFAAGVSLRNLLYDRHVFSVRKLAHPVVSIGNISVGGSGKTPFVICLGELLKQRGISFDVLSRGYGRRSTEIAVVDSEGTSEQFGDEPLLIARKLQAPVIVGGDRYKAGLLAEKKFSCKLHLLDDGFQHRRLHRDFDIVMLPARDMKDRLLPMGRLRESLGALRRADVLVLERDAPESPEAPATAGSANTWRVSRELTVDAATPLHDGRAVAFCGIAHPERFFTSLKDAGVEIAEKIIFPDHHHYHQRDIERLLQAKNKAGAEGFVTTEKDAVKLKPFSAALQPLRVTGLRLVLANPREALDELIRTVQDRTGCRL